MSTAMMTGHRSLTTKSKTDQMARTCQVCSHPRLYLIHAALLEGKPHARIAREFGLDRNAIIRHAANHMPQAMRDAADAARAGAGPTTMNVLAGEVLLGQAAEVYQRAMDTLDDLEKPGRDQRARVSALREVRACLETLAKLNWQVEDRGRGKIEQTGAPAIDEAIVLALQARGVGVQPPAPDTEPRPPLMLPPGDDDV